MKFTPRDVMHLADRIALSKSKTTEAFLTIATAKLTASELYTAFSQIPKEFQDEAFEQLKAIANSPN